MRKASGILDKTLYSIPYELHIPGYEYCGPNTRLEERLARGDKGINGLDAACKNHDIAYDQSNELSVRHQADKILQVKALERFHARNADWKEKLASLGVAAAMKAKVKLGMGLSKNISFVKILTRCEKELEKARGNINQCLTYISHYKENKAGNFAPRKKKQVRITKKRDRPIKKNKANENRMFVQEMELESLPAERKAVKRKLDVDMTEDDGILAKQLKVENPAPRKKLVPRRKYLKRKHEDDEEEYIESDILGEKIVKKFKTV